MQIKDLPNLKYIIDDVPKSILFELAKEVDFIRKNPKESIPWTENLSSNFPDAYKMINTVDVLEPYLIDLAFAYDEYCPNYKFWAGANIIKKSKIALTDLWVNFQTSGTFNPNHRHQGFFSFSIWLWIPYKHQTQQQNTVGAPVKGCFEFSYSSIIGELMHEIIPTDSTYHGKIIFFPSALNHCVYPFYSSDPESVRISVSGNLKSVSLE